MDEVHVRVLNSIINKSTLNYVFVMKNTLYTYITF